MDISITLNSKGRGVSEETIHVECDEETDAEDLAKSPEPVEVQVKDSADINEVINAEAHPLLNCDAEAEEVHENGICYGLEVEQAAQAQVAVLRKSDKAVQIEKSGLYIDSESIAVFGEHSSAVWAICTVYLGPGKLGVATASSDRTIVIHDLLSEEPLVATCRGHRDIVWQLDSIQVGEESLLVSISWDKRMVTWDPLTGKVVGKPYKDDHPLYSLATVCSKNTWLIVTGNRAGEVKVWNPELGTLHRKIKLHSDSIWSLKPVLLPNGRHGICSASDDKTIRAWDPVSGKQIWRACAPSRKKKNLPIPTPKPVQMLRKSHRGEVNCLCVIKIDEKTSVIASGSTDKSVKMWDASTGKFIAAYDGHEGNINSICSLQLKDGRHCFASCSDDSTIRVLDATNGQLVCVCKGKDRIPFIVACSVSGVGGREFLVGGTENGTSELFIPEKGGRSVLNFQDHVLEIRSMISLGNFDGISLFMQSSLDSRVSVRSIEAVELETST